MTPSTLPPKAAQVNGTRTTSNPANQTLYVSNLNDRIQKHDLRRALYTLFSTYGTVLDIVALKTTSMRGQAHIVFRDTQTSTQAMRALQGFEMFGKEMRVSYGKGKSDVISRLDGTAKMPSSKIEPSISSDAQKAIFSDPSLANSGKAPAGSGLNVLQSATEDKRNSPQGVKRPRDEESEDGDTPMEQDKEVEEEDDDDAMEESDEE